MSINSMSFISFGNPIEKGERLMKFYRSIVVFMVVTLAFCTNPLITVAAVQGRSTSTTILIPAVSNNQYPWFNYGKGTMVFTFDDSFKSVMTYAVPLMSSYNWQGTVYINPGVVESGSENKLNLSDLLYLQEAGWDVSSHGWTHVNTEILSSDELEDHLVLASQWLITHGFIKGARHYAPPFSKFDATAYAAAIKTSDDYPKGIYQTVRNYGEYSLFPGKNNGQIYAIQAAHDTKSWDIIQSKIDALTNSNKTLILIFHNIMADNATLAEYDTSLSRFNAILQYISVKGLNVLTMSQLLDIKESSQ